MARMLWHPTRYPTALVLIFALGGTRVPSAGVLDAYDFDAKPASRSSVPSSLREISGLAVSADGRVFAHDDESAEIQQLDPATGRRVLRFGPGRSPIDGDFEGLAIAAGRFFIITSEGTILEFDEGRDRERVEYRRHATGLGRVCDVEGLAWDRRSSALLAACKTMYQGGPPGIYAFDLRAMRLDPRPRYVVRRAEGRDVHPSGLAVHAATGHLVLVAARERLILELDRSGRLVGEHSLDRRDHPQAEGVEFLPDGSLLIADEGSGRRARLTRYRPMRETRP